MLMAAATQTSPKSSGNRLAPANEDKVNGGSLLKSRRSRLAI